LPGIIAVFAADAIPSRDRTAMGNSPLAADAALG
jgi:hypothetical protein